MSVKKKKVESAAKPAVKDKGKGKEKETPVRDAVVGEKRKRDEADDKESVRFEQQPSDSQQDEQRRKKKRKRKPVEAVTPVVDT